MPAVLVLVTALSAAEPKINGDSIETSVGETTYFQLTNSVQVGKPSLAVRVQNPNREHSVIKVAFEAGENGANNRLRIRNGYDAIVFFALNEGCLRMTEPASASARKDYLQVGVPPGREVSMDFAVSIQKIVMCDFGIWR